VVPAAKRQATNPRHQFGGLEADGQQPVPHASVGYGCSPCKPA
jgi:hypothetical protein